MGDIVIALLRAIGYPFIRHHSALGVASWILVSLVIGGVVYTAIGSFRNKAPHEKGRHEKNDPRP
jgi:hypothetical protein